MSWLSRITGAFKGGSTTAAAADLSPDEQLLHEVMERVRATPGVTAVRPLDDELGFVASTSNGDLTGYLTNLRADIRGASAGLREEKIARYVASLTTTFDKPESFEALAPSLRLVLRGADLIAVGYHPDRPRMAREVVPFVVEAVAQDTDVSIALLGLSSVTDLGATAEQAHAAAVANMRALQVTLESYDESSSVPLFTIADGDDYEASRLALPEWLGQLRGKVPGRPLVVMPTRSLVVIGGDADESTVARLLDIAIAEYGASPRSLSCVPYVFGDDGMLRELTLPPGHPLAGKLAQARHQLAAHTYNQQKEWLQKYYDDEMIERFAASYSVVSKDDVLSSYAVWSSDVIASLPVADTLVLRDSSVEGKFLRVPTSVARSMCGALLTEDTTVVPARLLTHGFPDAALLGALQAHAV